MSPLDAHVFAGRVYSSGKIVPLIRSLLVPDQGMISEENAYIDRLPVCVAK